MDPLQALDNLNQAVGMLQLTRQQHLILAKSVEVIRERLANPVPEPVNDEKVTQLVK